MQGLYSTTNSSPNPLCFSSAADFAIFLYDAKWGKGMFYEHKNSGLISRKRFVLRLLWHFLLALVIIFLTLSVGVVGHFFWGGESLHDAVLNAAFVMGGLGIVEVPTDPKGKFFYAFYGIFVGLSFAASIGIVLAPVAHRVMHMLHLDEVIIEDDEGDEVMVVEKSEQ